MLLVRKFPIRNRGELQRALGLTKSYNMVTLLELQPELQPEIKPV